MQPTEYKARIEGQFIYLYKTTTIIFILLTTTTTCIAVEQMFLFTRQHNARTITS